MERELQSHRRAAGAGRVAATTSPCLCAAFAPPGPSRPPPRPCPRKRLSTTTQTPARGVLRTAHPLGHTPHGPAPRPRATGRPRHAPRALPIPAKITPIPAKSSRGTCAATFAGGSENAIKPAKATTEGGGALGTAGAQRPRPSPAAGSASSRVHLKAPARRRAEPLPAGAHRPPRPADGARPGAAPSPPRHQRPRGRGPGSARKPGRAPRTCEPHRRPRAAHHTRRPREATRLTPRRPPGCPAGPRGSRRRRTFPPARPPRARLHLSLRQPRSLQGPGRGAGSGGGGCGGRAEPRPSPSAPPPGGNPRAANSRCSRRPGVAFRCAHPLPLPPPCSASSAPSERGALAEAGPLSSGGTPGGGGVGSPAGDWH